MRAVHPHSQSGGSLATAVQSFAKFAVSRPRINDPIRADFFGGAKRRDADHRRNKNDLTEAIREREPDQQTGRERPAITISTAPTTHAAANVRGYTVLPKLSGIQCVVKSKAATSAA